MPSDDLAGALWRACRYLVWQYVRFSDICREQYRKYGRTKKAVEETIRICIEQHILEEYLKRRKKEVMETMNILYDQEYTWSVSMKEAREEAMRQGIAQGLKQGVAQGLKQGVAQGLKRGIAQGIDQGSRKVLQNVVNNMAAKGYSSDEIAEAVDVDEETVKAWLNS